MTQERNTPRDILFDMEDDVSTLRRHARIALCLSQDDGLEDVLQDALAQVSIGPLDCHRDLKDKFTRLFDQIVRADGETPKPPAGFDDIFAAWNANRKQQQSVTDDEAERLNEQEEALLDQIVNTRAPNAGSIAAKVIVAKQLIEQVTSRWTDERDVRVLDSVLVDLTALGAPEGEPP
jgi:hypothetical protein